MIGLAAAIMLLGLGRIAGVSGLASRAMLIERGGAPIMFGRATISISRSKPSNSDGSAVSTLTGCVAGNSRTIAIVRWACPRP